MVVSDAIHNIMGGMESTAGVRLHNHRRKLKQRFDIIKKLGQGTYGKVQLGINKETGQEVAIKTIKKSKIETEADLIRIRREIQIMSSVQHPNIIHIYEVFENREKMVLVMEYAAGGELYDFLSERKVLAEAEARRIFRQISTAVYYCHKHKICHRDLKLENILLDEHGGAKIADFGLSNVFDSRHLLGTFCGSPLYASPEIVKGTPYRGPEVDCWSLGVLLYTLVYGAMPFDGSNFKRLVKQISQGDYFEPKKPSPASSLIRDMLHVDPDRRADIVKICSHWWLNDGEAESCAALAEQLANQTPVRLDLLLSLAPPTTPEAGAEGEAGGKELAAGEASAGPARSQSVGSLMQLDHPRSYEATRRASNAGQDEVANEATKRKLEEGSSTDQANHGGAKRKDRSRHREKSTERTSERKHRSSSRSKQPKAVAKTDAAEAIATTSGEREVKPSVASAEADVVTPAEAMEVDVDESSEAKQDVGESRSKDDAEENKTKVAKVEGESSKSEQVSEATAISSGMEQNKENVEGAKEEAKASDDSKKVKVKRKKKVETKAADTKEDVTKEVESLRKEESSTAEPSAKSDDIVSVKQDGDAKESSQVLTESDVNKVAPEEKTVEMKAEGTKAEVSKPEGAEVKETKVKVVKKVVKKKSDLGLGKSTTAVDKVKSTTAADKAAPADEATPPTKPMVRRRSKIFESEIQKFNNMGTPELKSPTVEKPKKIFIPGVKVGDFKRAYERKSSVDLSSTTSVPARVKTSPTKKLDKDAESDVSYSESSASASVGKSIEKEAEETDQKDVETVLKDVDNVKKDVAVKKDDVGTVKKTESGTVKKVAAVKKADVTTVKKDDTVTSNKDITVKDDIVPVQKTDVPLATKTEVSSEKKSDVAPVQKDISTVKKADVVGKKTNAEPVSKPVLSDKPVPETKVVNVPVAPKDEARPVTAADAAPDKPPVKDDELKKLKKNAIEIIGNAIAKPPKPMLDKLKMKAPAVKSPPETPKKAEAVPAVKNVASPLSPTGKKFVKIQVGPNDIRNAVLQVSTPEHIQNFNYNETRGEEGTAAVNKETSAQNMEERDKPEKKVSTKVEITLKSATLPRRKTSKAEIQLGSPAKQDKPGEYRSEVEHMVGVANPSRLRNQRSEVAFPVAAATPLAHRSVSVEPESGAKGKPRERIIPIQFDREAGDRPAVASPPPSKPPAGPLMQQRSMSQRSSSLSRQSTLDSDSESAGGPEPIRKSPREFIIPIAVEGGGYVTPRAGSLEPGPDNPADRLPKLHRFKPMRMGSLLSDGGASEDEGFNSLSSPFTTLNRHRDADEEFGSHMHRLRSTRPTRPTAERADSGSSGEEDDDDGFELLTAESLFSTLLSRVRNLTQRLNTDEGGRPTFPSSRFMNHNFPSHSSFFGNMEPLSSCHPAPAREKKTTTYTRVSESTRPASRDDSLPSWRRSASRDQSDCDSVYSESANSNATLPRGSSRHDMSDAPSDASSSYYTPSLSRRIHRNADQDSSYGPRLPPSSTLPSRRPISRTTSLKTNDDATKRKNHLPPLNNAGYVARSTDNVRKLAERNSDRYSNAPPDDARRSYASSLESNDRYGSTESVDYAARRDYSRERSARDERGVPKSYLPPTRRALGVLNGGGGSNSLPRRQQYRSAMSDTDYSRKHLSHLTEEINHYDPETTLPPTSRYAPRDNGVQRSTSYLRQRALDIANIYGAPLSAAEPTRLERDESRSYDNFSGMSTPTNQSSTNLNFYDDKGSKYGDKMSDLAGERVQPSLLTRYRSGSLNRESGNARETGSDVIIRRQKSYDRLAPGEAKPRRPVSLDLHATPDKSVLSKFFPGSDGKTAENDAFLKVDDPSPARSPGRKVSRFLRPDFYDTPREDSQFAKEKDEALKSAKENGSNQQEVGNGRQSSPKSKQANIANFLEMNYADLERNIAKDLLAISENASKQNAAAEAERIAMFTNDGSSLAGKDLNLESRVESSSQSVAEANQSVKLDSTLEGTSGTLPNRVDCVRNEVKSNPSTELKSGNLPQNVGNGIKPQAVKKVVGSGIVVPSKPSFEKTSSSSDTEIKTSGAPVVDVAVVNGVPKQELSKDVMKETNLMKSKVESEESTANQKADTSEGLSKLKLKKKVKKLPDAEIANQDSEVSNVESKAVVKKKTTPITDANGSVSNKNKFLRSLDKTFEKFKSSDSETNSKSRIKKVIRNLRESSLTPSGSDNVSESNLIKRAVSVDDCSEENLDKSSNKIKRVIKSLKELASTPKASLDSENNLLKRATSIDDLSNPSQTKSNQVNSVLGKFKKMEEPKAEKKVSLLNRFRRTQSVYAGSASDGVLVRDPGNGSSEANPNAKMNRNSLGFENVTRDFGEATVEDVLPGLKNYGDSKADVTPDASCTMRVKAAKKEVLAGSVENGTAKDDDVSISATVKVVKVVKNEANASDVLKQPNDRPKTASKIPQSGRATSNGAADKEDRFRDAQSTVHPSERRGSKVKHFDPNSSVLSEDESESFDSCSVGSDWDPRTTSPLPAYYPSSRLEGPTNGVESIEDRIRRKSFYSRFNDPKKKQAAARKLSATGIPTLRDATPHRSSSFVNQDATGKPF